MDYLAGDWQAQLAVLARVAFAAVLGGLVGLEREIAARPAGLRTNMLLCAAAALLVAISDLLAERFASEHYAPLVRVDPVRVIEAVVTGVAFLGAGTIFRRGGDMVTGLTTAASMLLVAAIGVVVGLGQHVLAVGAAVLALAVLRGLAALELRAAHSARRPPSKTPAD